MATPHEVSAFRQEYDLGTDKIIGCVGRLHRGKRIQIAIEALAEVRKQVGNARLLIIGGHDLPDLDFAVSFSPRAAIPQPWDRYTERRESMAAVHNLIEHGVWNC